MRWSCDKTHDIIISQWSWILIAKGKTTRFNSDSSIYSQESTTILTARLHYRTVLERFSENRSGSLQNSFALRLHCPQRTGPDWSKPFCSINACIPVLINNYYFKRKHTSCWKNTPSKLSPKYMFLVAVVFCQSSSPFLPLLPFLGVQCILLLATKLSSLMKYCNSWLYRTSRMVLVLKTIVFISSQLKFRERPGVS